MVGNGRIARVAVEEARVRRRLRSAVEARRVRRRQVPRGSHLLDPSATRSRPAACDPRAVTLASHTPPLPARFVSHSHSPRASSCRAAHRDSHFVLRLLSRTTSDHLPATDDLSIHFDQRPPATAVSIYLSTDQFPLTSASCSSLRPTTTDHLYTHRALTDLGVPQQHAELVEREHERLDKAEARAHRHGVRAAARELIEAVVVAHL